MKTNVKNNNINIDNINKTINKNNENIKDEVENNKLPHQNIDIHFNFFDKEKDNPNFKNEVLLLIKEQQEKEERSIFKTIIVFISSILNYIYKEIFIPYKKLFTLMFFILIILITAYIVLRYIYKPVLIS